jgi:hypothetical protein
MRPLSLFVLPALAVSLAAQSTAVPGIDIRIYEVGSPTIYGRRGAAYPNGEIAMAIGHSMCNGGTVPIPWLGTSGGLMLATYPRIAFLIARESGGRLVQVSNKATMKHSRIAFNFGGGPCGPCTSGPSNTFRVGCSDVYTTGFNGNQGTLGPTTEVDPWTGNWNPVGSLFDSGDPSVGGAAATDGVYSLTTAGWDQFRNRMLVREPELAVPGAIFYGQSHVSVIGEPGDVRSNNMGSRPLNITWNGSLWTTSLTSGGAFVGGSVLNRWIGATVTQARNGNDDGHFVVGVRVTGPVNGLWHYEYAIHNQDNARGGAAFRLPVCATARVVAAGFRDLDTDPLNDWTVSRSGGELAFLGAANNPHDWNTIYNVWFDCDAAPVAGTMTIDEARIGPGALTVAVPTTVPGLLGTEDLGAGCPGSPSLFANGLPSSPNLAYALQTSGTPNAFVAFAFASLPAAVSLGGGCTQYVDGATLIGAFPIQANASGQASFALPIPAALSPTDLAVQAFEVAANGPVLGFLLASNGVRVRAAGTGCP